MTKTRQITLYTDGAAKHNPGQGGYAAILTCQNTSKEICGAYKKTTNNRMELMAIIRGLEAIKKAFQNIHIYSDSKYVVDAVGKGWLVRWQKNGFKGKKNADLWRRFLQAYQKHTVTLNWIKGHAGHPNNERCDELAKQCATFGPWQTDVGYHKASRTGKSL